MGQVVGTGIGRMRTSPVSYRHNFLVCFQNNPKNLDLSYIKVFDRYRWSYDQLNTGWAYHFDLSEKLYEMLGNSPDPEQTASKMQAGLFPLWLLFFQMW